MVLVLDQETIAVMTRRASKVPNVTGRTALATAPRSKKDSPVPRRLPMTISPHAKQMAGISVMVSMTAWVMDDKSPWNPAPAQNAEKPRNQMIEQSRSPMEATSGETGVRAMLWMVFILVECILFGLLCLFVGEIEDASNG